MATIEQEIGQALYAIPCVEEVRREDVPKGGVVFWVNANNVSVANLDALLAARTAVRQRHGFPYIGLEVSDRFDRPRLHSVFMDELSLVPREG